MGEANKGVSETSGGRRKGRWALIGVCALVGAAFAPAETLLLDGPLGTSASAQEAADIDLSGFSAWRDAFRPRALAAGVGARTFDTAFDGVEAQRSIIERDRNQAEFNLAIWEYLERAVSNQRISNGRAALLAHGPSLQAIEDRYGVPKEVVVAIWGVESSYGQIRGSNDVIASIATLAFEGRRRQRFEAELIAALMILEAGDVAPRDMVGSWAGAMGHTQFMPSSYLELAVDFDGDGRRDIWSDDPVDALASTAQYLSARGWRPGEPWGVQVSLPPEFDYRLIEGGPRTTAFWAERGVTLANGDPLPAGISGAALFLPAGHRGPTFLTFNNFRVILSYNPASAYALAVALLSEEIGGAPSRTFGWPVDDRSLVRTEAEELQQLLTELNFDTGGVDGIIGANSRSAIRRFQAANGLVPDGYASLSLLEYVRQTRDARTTPLLGGQADTTPLSEAELREIQVFLQANELYLDGPVDGQIGPMTRAALVDFVERNNLDILPEPSREMLEALRAATLGD